jgi:hypothetical protein
LPSNAITPALHSVDQEPAVAGRVFGAKAEHRQRGAVLQGRAQARKGRD